MRVVICQHGVGNVASVKRAVERAVVDAGKTADVLLSGDPDVVRRADRIVVPGQGAFAAFAAGIRGGLGEALGESIRAGTPYLGICLGLQVLFDASDEAPGERGLGILRGRVRRLEPASDAATGRQLPLPHMGWNVVTPNRADDAPAHYYFAHSYVAHPEDASVVAGTTDYGGRFVSMVAQDNVLGVQFHPEKSQREGIDLLARFFRR